MTIEKLLILCFAFAIYVGLLISIPIRRKTAASKGIALPKITPRHIGILICGGIIILLLLIREFGLLVNAVICATGLLATNMSVMELCGKGEKVKNADSDNSEKPESEENI